jgi:hypothetical protein
MSAGRRADQLPTEGPGRAGAEIGLQLERQLQLELIEK